MDVAKFRFGFLIVVALTVATLSACGKSNDAGSAVFPKTTSACSSTAVSNQYVVKWKDGTSVVYKNTTREQLLASVVEPNIQDIEFAEQDQKVRVPRLPTTLTTQAVATGNSWGQTIVKANDAWAQGYNGQGVLVAVIDSGVQRDHPQLVAQMYINPGESGVVNGVNRASNGIDDDDNGYIDDVSGYDFNKNSATVTDGTGHGTHVAGIIGASHSAGSVQGVAEGVKILPLDFMDDDGSGNISDAIRAMYYAAAMGAKVVNASWGGAPVHEIFRTRSTILGRRAFSLSVPQATTA